MSDSASEPVPVTDVESEIDIHAAGDREAAEALGREVSRITEQAGAKTGPEDSGGVGEAVGEMMSGTMEERRQREARAAEEGSAASSRRVGTDDERPAG